MVGDPIMREQSKPKDFCDSSRMHCHVRNTHHAQHPHQPKRRFCVSENPFPSEAVRTSLRCSWGLDLLEFGICFNRPVEVSSPKWMVMVTSDDFFSNLLVKTYLISKYFEHGIEKKSTENHQGKGDFHFLLPSFNRSITGVLWDVYDFRTRPYLPTRVGSIAQASTS